MGRVIFSDGRCDAHQYFDFLWSTNPHFAISFWYGLSVNDFYMKGL